MARGPGPGWQQLPTSWAPGHRLRYCSLRQRPATRGLWPNAGSAALSTGRRRLLWPGKELRGVASESINNPAPSCTLQTRPQGFILLLWEGLAQPPPDATMELWGWGGAAAREVWAHVSKGCRGAAGCSAQTEMNSALCVNMTQVEKENQRKIPPWNPSSDVYGTPLSSSIKWDNNRKLLAGPTCSSPWPTVSTPTQ